MRIIRVKNYQELSVRAADIISAIITLKPDCVLGLATGSTPIGTYAELVKKYENNQLDFSYVKSVNLDEYMGLGINDPQSYVYFMNEHLFSKINIKTENTHLPNGLELDNDKACREYENTLNNIGSIDIQLLGLGRDGHIGFNEPNVEFIKITHCVDLTEETIDANKRFFSSIDEVPKKAYTMGIKNIMNAKMVLMLVSGKDKADILNKAINGPINPNVPASILQLHPNFILVADEEALSCMQ